MGYDVQLVAKTRNEEVRNEIFDCVEKNGPANLSRDFAMFQSRNFDGCELQQLEILIDKDLSILQRYPKNYELDTGELEYRLYLAEQNGQHSKIKNILTQIKEAEEEWDKTFESDHDGWTVVTEFRNFIESLIQELYLYDDLSKRIRVPEGWDYYWESYFNTDKDGYNKSDRLVDDLERLLIEIECMEKYEINHVGIVGN